MFRVLTQPVRVATSLMSHVTHAVMNKIFTSETTGRGENRGLRKVVVGGTTWKYLPLSRACFHVYKRHGYRPCNLVIPSVRCHDSPSFTFFGRQNRCDKKGDMSTQSPVIFNTPKRKFPRVTIHFVRPMTGKSERRMRRPKQRNYRRPHPLTPCRTNPLFFLFLKIIRST